MGRLSLADGSRDIRFKLLYKRLFIGTIYRLFPINDVILRLQNVCPFVQTLKRIHIFRSMLMEHWCIHCSETKAKFDFLVMRY